MAFGLVTPVFATDCITNPNDPVCTNSVVVTAQVPSHVSSLLSTVTTNLSELPADGVSSVLITVIVKLEDGNPAANKSVEILSNRGNVDVFSVYGGNNLTAGNQGTTDSSGIIKFTARSTAPGVTTFTVNAETITLSSKPSVTFTPLPLLKKLVVSVEIPWKGKIVIFQPSKPAANIYPSEEKLVNTQIEMQIPFWILIIILIVLVSSPILFILLVILFFRLRLVLLARDRQQEKENDLLTKIYALEQDISRGQTLEIEKEDQIITREKEIKDTINKEVKSE